MAFVKFTRNFKDVLRYFISIVFKGTPCGNLVVEYFIKHFLVNGIHRLQNVFAVYSGKYLA